MKRRTRGFSLVELSFVLIIILILAGITAGGGAYLSNEAKSRKMAELAKEMFNAVGMYRANWNGHPDGVGFDGSTAIPATASRWTTLGTTTYQDPWTGATKMLTAKRPPFTQADYGTVPGPANWGLGNPGAVRLVYFAADAGQTQIVVWDQDQMYTFSSYAIQALDHRGYAVATYGK